MSAQQNSKPFLDAFKFVIWIMPTVSVFAIIGAILVEYVTAIQWANKLGRSKLVVAIFSSLSQDITLISFGAIMLCISTPFILGYMASIKPGLGRKDGSLPTVPTKKQKMMADVGEKLKTLRLATLNKARKNRFIYKIISITRGAVSLTKKGGGWLGTIIVLVTLCGGSYLLSRDLLDKWEHAGWYAFAIWILSSLIYAGAIFSKQRRTIIEFLLAAFLLCAAQLSSIIIFFTTISQDVAFDASPINSFLLALIIGISVTPALAGLYTGLYSVRNSVALIAGNITMIFMIYVALLFNVPEQILMNRYDGVISSHAIFHLDGVKAPMSCVQHKQMYLWSSDNVTYFSCHGNYLHDKSYVKTMFYGKIYHDRNTLNSDLLTKQLQPSAVITRVVCAPHFYNEMPKKWFPSNGIRLECAIKYNIKDFPQYH